MLSTTGYGSRANKVYILINLRFTSNQSVSFPWRQDGALLFSPVQGSGPRVTFSSNVIYNISHLNAYKAPPASATPFSTKAHVFYEWPLNTVLHKNSACNRFIENTAPSKVVPKLTCIILLQTKAACYSPLF